VVSSLGTLRQTTQPTPTVTSNPLHVGPHITDLKPLTPGQVSNVMGMDGELIPYFSWPAHTANTQKHKDLAQIVPPHATAALMLAPHSSAGKAATEFIQFAGGCLHSTMGPECLFAEDGRSLHC